MGKHNIPLYIKKSDPLDFFYYRLKQFSKPLTCKILNNNIYIMPPELAL